MTWIVPGSGSKEMAYCICHSDLGCVLNNAQMSVYREFRSPLGRMNIVIKKRLMNSGKEDQTRCVVSGGGVGESVSRTKQPANCAAEYCDH